MEVYFTMKRNLASLTLLCFLQGALGNCFSCSLFRDEHCCRDGERSYCCSKEEFFHGGSMRFGTVAGIMVGLFVTFVALVCICTQCPGCPVYKRRRQMLTAHNYGYVPPTTNTIPQFQQGGGVIVQPSYLAQQSQPGSLPYQLHTPSGAYQPPNPMSQPTSVPQFGMPTHQSGHMPQPGPMPMPQPSNMPQMGMPLHQSTSNPVPSMPMPQPEMPSTYVNPGQQGVPSFVAPPYSEDPPPSFNEAVKQATYSRQSAFNPHY